MSTGPHYYNSTTDKPLSSDEVAELVRVSQRRVAIGKKGGESARRGLVGNPLSGIVVPLMMPYAAEPDSPLGRLFKPKDDGSFSDPVADSLPAIVIDDPSKREMKQILADTIQRIADEQEQLNLRRTEFASLSQALKTAEVGVEFHRDPVSHVPFPVAICDIPVETLDRLHRVLGEDQKKRFGRVFGSFTPYNLEHGSSRKVPAKIFPTQEQAEQTVSEVTQAFAEWTPYLDTRVVEIDRRVTTCKSEIRAASIVDGLIDKMPEEAVQRFKSSCPEWSPDLLPDWSRTPPSQILSALEEGVPRPIAVARRARAHAATWGRTLKRLSLMGGIRHPRKSHSSELNPK